MTANQIEYNKLLETRRANRANERITSERDQRSYEVNLFNANEQARHNRATELLNQRSLDEQSRHNLASELQARLNLQEQQRSNIARENISLMQHQEQVRSNMAREVLNAASLADQSIFHAAQAVNMYGQLGETIRANTARETLNSYSIQTNLMEQERNRQQQLRIANQQNLINQTRNDIQAGYLAEQQRANAVREKQEAKRILLSGITQGLSSFGSTLSSVARVLPLIA